jgi:hypothetical protein
VAASGRVNRFGLGASAIAARLGDLRQFIRAARRWLLRVSVLFSRLLIALGLLRCLGSHRPQRCQGEGTQGGTTCPGCDQLPVTGADLGGAMGWML